MKKLTFFIALLLFTTLIYSQYTNSDIKLIYSGLHFKIPKDNIAIGSNGGKDNFLVFKYSDQPQKKYIAFSKMLREPGVKYNCELSIFIKDAFLKKNDSVCNHNELDSFNKVFLANTDNGVWEGKGTTLYYTISSKDIFLFIVDPHGTVIKIDTDFVDKNGLKRIVSDITN